MDAKSLSGLRPLGDTSDQIRASLSRIEAATAEAHTNLPRLQQRRTEALLHGTPEQVLAAENEMRKAEILIEQMGSLHEAIMPALVSAQAQEAIIAFRVRASEAEARIATANEWWLTQYPKLAGAIRNGLLLILEAQAMAASLRQEELQLMSTCGVRDAGGVKTDFPEFPQTYVAPYGAISPAHAIQLPFDAAGCGPYWWPEDLYGRPRTG